MITRTAYSYVRFSSPAQSTGDSVNRQIEGSRRYAQTNGFLLDETLRVDTGVSAMHGLNASKGSLGEFIKLIQNGHIARGSVLLVESPDRVSRQPFSEAWPTYQRILDGGVEIHFVSLNDVLRPDHSFTDILRVGLEVDRANNESKIKSERVSAAWSRKRREARGDRAMSSKVPLWLQAEKGQPITPIPERAKLIRRIYQLSLSGLGQYSIADKLNVEGVRPWGRTREWTPGYIGELLRSRATIGEYQPHDAPKHGKRTPDGDPNSGYYPAVVSSDLWRRVQDRRVNLYQSKRGKFTAGNAGGGTNTTANLFRKLVWDTDNDCRMVYRHSERDGRSYACLVSKHRESRSQHKIRYEWFENAFLSWADTVEWVKIADEGDTLEARSIATELEEIAKAIGGTEKLIARYAKIVSDPDDVLYEEIMHLYRAAVQERKSLKAQRDAIDSKLAALQSSATNLRDSAGLRKVIVRLSRDEDRIRLRAAIAARIQRIDLTFRHRSTVPADITFSNGQKRRIAFKKYNGLRIDNEEAVRAIGDGVDKLLIYPVELESAPRRTGSARKRRGTGK
jgi:DNA invertase Pin-like site-specific DNA recombinase